ncbi:MAG: DUF4258 domain-containing protein [Chloroflexota bacterium]
MEQVVISDHARFEMDRRHIDEEVVLKVAHNPEQVLTAGKGRLVHQGKYHDPVEAREMLLRVVLERRAGELHVVTVYKTSRIDKYWRREVQEQE